MSRNDAPEAAQGRGPRAEWKRDVAAFLGGQTVSLFGSMLVQYAVFWYLTIHFQSGVIMMLAAVFGFLPQAVVSLFGGVWADRHNRKRLIIAADGTIALTTLVLAAVMLAGYAEPWLIFATLAIRSAGAGVQMPAVSSLIPQITPAAELMRVNGILSAVQSAMALIAPAAAAAIYAWASAGAGDTPQAVVPLLFIDVVTAIIGIGLLATIPVATVRSAAEAASSVVGDLVEGIRYIAEHGVVRWLLVLYAIVFVLIVAPSNLTPLMVVRTFPSDDGGVANLAILEIAFSVGMVVGGVIVATIAAKLDRIRLIAASSLAFGGLAIALGLAPTVLVFFAFMLLVGLVVPFFSTPSMTLLQETVEPERQGRVFGFVSIVMAVAAPVGMVVFGPLADIVPVESILVATGLLTFVVVGLALWLPTGRRAAAEARAAGARAAARGAPVPEAE